MSRQSFFSIFVASLICLAVMVNPCHVQSQQLFVTDLFTDSVLRYDASDGRALPAAGQTDAVFAQGSGGDHVLGLAFGPDGNLYVSGYGSGTILRFDGHTGNPLPAAGQQGAVFIAQNGLGAPIGLKFGQDQNLYVANRDSNSPFQSSILRFDGKTGAPLPAFGNTGAVFARADNSGIFHDFTFDSQGNLYVDESVRNDVAMYDGVTGEFVKTFVSPGSGGLDNPQGISFGPDGDLYISSVLSNNVLRYDGKTGAFLDVFASGPELNQPEGLAFGFDNNLYVTSVAYGDNISVYDGRTGAFLKTLISFETTSSHAPLYITFSVPELSAINSLTLLCLCGTFLLVRSKIMRSKLRGRNS
jgi:DNA-binding beta-propeller fold protein YncE